MSHRLEKPIDYLASMATRVAREQRCGFVLLLVDTDGSVVKAHNLEGPGFIEHVLLTVLQHTDESAFIVVPEEAKS